jgi:hypothetical protein
MSEQRLSVSDELREIVSRIDTAASQQYKSTDGHTYSAVPLRTLAKWSSVCERALRDSSQLPYTEKELERTRQRCVDLQNASKSYYEREETLKKEVSIAREAALTAQARKQKELDDLKSVVKTLEAEKADLELAKKSTIEAMEKIEAGIKAPEAKYVPEVALNLQREKKELEVDLRKANDMMAATRAAESARRSELDQLQKELAKERFKVEAARTELAQFQRDTRGAAAGIKELFDHSALDEEVLITHFGKKAVQRLKEALKVQPTDVRGRLAKLTGALTHMAGELGDRFKALLSVVQKALSWARESSTSVGAVIAGWANGLLKDIVLLQIQPVRVYRAELERCIATVRALPPNTGAKEKIRRVRESADPRLSWADVAANRQAKAAAGVKRMKQFAAKVAGLRKSAAKALRKATEALKAFGSLAYDAVSTLSTGAASAVQGVYHWVVGVLKHPSARYTSVPTEPLDAEMEVQLSDLERTISNEADQTQVENPANA